VHAEDGGARGEEDEAIRRSVMRDGSDEGLREKSETDV
jgi:hypothetical protein